MTFIQSISVCFSKYADFTGRASRSEFWWWTLFTALVSFFLGLASDLVSSLFLLVVCVPGLAVGARRLHDTSKSGWWQLIWFIPILGWIILIVLMSQKGQYENKFGLPVSS